LIASTVTTGSTNSSVRTYSVNALTGAATFIGASATITGFGDVPGAGARRWDAALWRVETGIGYLLRRNVGLKLAYQHDRRDTTTREVLAVQGLAWF